MQKARKIVHTAGIYAGYPEVLEGDPWHCMTRELQELTLVTPALLATEAIAHFRAHTQGWPFPRTIPGDPGPPLEGPLIPPQIKPKSFTYAAILRISTINYFVKLG